jgi:CofD-related protein of GAK system
MPAAFDLRMASIGNLILAGCYLSNERDMDSVVYLFSRLVEARGIVRPIVDADLHLEAETADGTRIVGQHLLTGKGQPVIRSPIVDLRLIDGLDRPCRAEVTVSEKSVRLIREADVICFPMGSFYTSVVANLLPAGVGRAVRAATCPKVYVPNTGRDPEQLGMSVSDAVSALLRHVRADAGADTRAEDVVQHVVVDTANGDYQATLDLERLVELGVGVVDTDLVTDASHPRIDRERLAEVLVSLA